MALANFLDLGHGSLVREHGQIRPQVMFDLVVQPSVKEINEIGSGGKVGRRHNLTQVKGSTARTAWNTKGVQIITSMVGSDNDEGVYVGKYIRQEQCCHGIQVPRIG